MTFQAFSGSQTVKNRMIAPVRAQWTARALAPDTDLNWNRDGQPDSINGALAQTQDRTVFEQRTGIPADLAQLCEHLVAAGVRKSDAPDTAAGFALEGADAVLAFGIGWLDAIRPGADLGMIVPQFARHCLNRLLEPNFALAGHISPDLRGAGLQILAFWDRELAGHTMTRGDWRDVQRQAMAATAKDTDPWSYRIATFIEALAWPVRSVSREFVGLFEPFLFNWLIYCETAFMTDEERTDREHLLLAWKAMATAPRDEGVNIDFDPLESLPQSARVISVDHVMRTMDRMIAIREAARPRKDEVILDLMNGLLTLIRAA
ncbi:hypothetical protein Q4610_06185 [Sphingobium sp. HBC34]|uniref:Uncharacterized protein n=1 Tax=Sphingobium cyanobacteriorum TaxID=3063954 RepID=A0ABT8ZJC1_9SPHN|nr:hypothetical protein [Sphingobium sp. HBC34]MDO7834630.1 hypothetical protein [Sphingobium sp. HBC34]